MIGGQKVELTDGGNIKFRIESIFKSAGMMYRFPNKCSGIGINEEIVDVAFLEKRDLIISVGNSNRLYWIAPARVMKIAEKYGSIYTLSSGMRLFVVPLKELMPIGGDIHGKM